MLPVKVVRSLVLGETMSNPFHHHHHHDDHDNAHDADDEHDDDHHHPHHHHHHRRKNKRKLPLLLFTPTKELISDTFRLAAIARDIGMDFHPTPSLSHLIFSWPSPSSSLPSPFTPSSSSSSSPFTPSSSSSSYNNHRPSTSSTSSSSSTVLSTSSSILLQNDAVPLPFPSLSSHTTSLSLLRFFVSLSKGLFKLVFLNLTPDLEANPLINRNYPSNFESCPANLHSRVSGRKVGSMDELSREMAARGWALFRTQQHKGKGKGKGKTTSDLVYLFRKKELNRVRVRGGVNGNGVGECRVRELRLPTLDFSTGVPFRVLMYILLMADDVFYLAQP